MAGLITYGNKLSLEGNDDVIKINKEYYDTNKKDIDRFTVTGNKISYDTPQLEILGDIFAGSKNIALSVINRMAANSYRNAEKQIKEHGQNIDLSSFIKEAEEKRIEYKDLANSFKEEYRRKIELEPNMTQKWTMSAAAESLRVATDIRQIPVILGTTILSPYAAGYIGATTTAAKLGTNAILNGIENIIQDSADIYISEGRTPEVDEIIYSGLGGVGAGLFFAGIGMGINKGINIAGKKIDEIAMKRNEAARKNNSIKIIRNLFEEAGKEIKNNSILNRGDTTIKDLENIVAIKDNLNFINEYKGIQGSEKGLLKKHIYINDVQKFQADIYAKAIVLKLIDDPDVDFIKNGTDFNKILNENPILIRNLAKEYVNSGKLGEGEKKAFDFFLDLTTPDKINDVRVDVPGMIQEVDKNINTSDTAYEPLFEDMKIQHHIVDSETFEKKKRKIKHSYNDFKAGELQANLEKDGIIPTEAKIKFIRGNREKIPYDELVLITEHGTPITRKKWLKGDAHITFEYELEGKKYFGDYRLTEQHGYLGDTYELDINAAPNTNKNVTPQKKVTNIVDDINGTPEPVKPITEKEMYDIVYKSLGLDQKYKGMRELNTFMLSLQKMVGQKIKEKYNLNTLEEAVEFYQKKYNINFEFLGNQNFNGAKAGKRIGETIIKKVNGETTLQIVINNAVEDLDTQLGVLRHEIQHIIDYYKDPRFNSRGFSDWWITENDTIGEALNKLGRNHFADFPEEYFEVSYIIKNEIKDLAKKLEAGEETDIILKRLGLDIPNIRSAEDNIAMSEMLKSVSDENDVATAVAKLRKSFSKYAKWKNDIPDIFWKSKNVGHASNLMSEYLETNLFIPYEKTKQQMEGMLTNAFNITYKGDKLNPDKLITEFEKQGESLAHYLFRWDYKKLPESLKELEPDILRLRQEFYDTIKNLTNGYEITVEDVVNNFMFDHNLTVEKYLRKEEILKYLGDDNKVDLDRFIRGDLSYDELVELDIPERLLNVRNAFAEDNLEFFESAPETLLNNLKGKNKPSKEKIIKLMTKANECMTSSEKKNLVKKYKLEDIPAIKEHIEKSNFYKEIDENLITQNIIESRRNNAKYFYTMDMMSKKGTYKNKLLGGHLHRFGRFDDFINGEKIIKRKNLTRLINKNKTSDRTAIKRFIKEIAISKAIKDNLPGHGINGIKQILNETQRKTANDTYKTLVRAIEKKVEERIGMDLGIVTKPPKTTGDKVVTNFLSMSNKVSLTGLKFAKDFIFEAPTMARASTMLYGAGGFTETYKNFLKAAQVLYLSKEMFDKYDKALGSRFEHSVPLKFFNSVMDKADDVTGEIAERINKYGTRWEKGVSKFDDILNKLNFYGESQKVMKLAAFFEGAEILRLFGEYQDLDSLLSKNTPYIKDLFKNIGIDDMDFYFIKKLKEVPEFNELGVFNEIDLFDTINKTDIEKHLGRVLSDEEFKIIRQNSAEKITKLHDKIVADVSPTETNPSMRNAIDNIENPVHRNFMRLMGNFKVSIQEQWRRMYRDLIASNMNNGQFNWGNKVWQKRLFKHFLGLGGLYGGLELVTDLDFYTDPIATINEKIDNLIDNPGSAFWEIIDSQVNSWALVNGSAVARRPIQIAQNISKGDLEKASANLLKLGLGTSNVNMAKDGYKLIEKIVEE